MTTPTSTTVTYRVTLTRERFRGRECIVARDTNHDWRAYGDAPNTPMTTQELAEYLFHREEIAATGVDERGQVFADIIDFAATRRKSEAELPETSGGSV